MSTISVEVDIDDVFGQMDAYDILKNVDDNRLAEEYYRRNLGGEAETWDEEAELTKAYLAHHNGEREKAYEILWKMCLIKLNKVV